MSNKAVEEAVVEICNEACEVPHSDWLTDGGEGNPEHPPCYFGNEGEHEKCRKCRSYFKPILESLTTKALEAERKRIRESGGVCDHDFRYRTKLGVGELECEKCGAIYKVGEPNTIETVTRQATLTEVGHKLSVACMVSNSFRCGCYLKITEIEEALSKLKKIAITPTSKGE